MSDIFTNNARHLIRYTRVYGDHYFTQYYRTYHNVYSAFVRYKSYRPKTSFAVTRRCANFEANSRGNYIGFFSCPLPFEPTNFTNCCGVPYSHYCCAEDAWASPLNSTSNDLWGISFNTLLIGLGGTLGVLVFIALLWMIVSSLMTACSKTRPRQRNRVNALNIGPNNRVIFSMPQRPLAVVPQPPPYSPPPPSYSMAVVSEITPSSPPPPYRPPSAMPDVS